jgi:hypothetical protein
MKRFFIILLSVCFSVSGFAATTWDKPFGKPAFDDPYVDLHYASVTGSPGYPNYSITVVADFNKTVGVPYYVILQVYGVWAGIGVGYKQFTLLYSSVQWHKTLTYNMNASEEAYTETEELVDYGPQ